MTVSPVTPIAPVAQGAPASAAATGGGSFQAAFAGAVAQVESFLHNAQQSVNLFLSGEAEELHRVALAAKQAELSFDLFLQVRNKIVAAYEEVMRMQV